MQGEGFNPATQKKLLLLMQLFSTTEKPRAGYVHWTCPFESPSLDQTNKPTLSGLICLVQGEGFEPPKAKAIWFTVRPRWPLEYPCTLFEDKKQLSINIYQVYNYGITIISKAKLLSIIENCELKIVNCFCLGKSLEPPVGFEPTTFTLQKCCSTAELRWLKDLVVTTAAVYQNRG